MAGRVVVVGSLNLDHTVSVAELPARGATVAGRSYATAAGGKGLNQAVAAARQGAEVVMVGAVGDDQAGGLLAGVLVDEGIATTGLQRLASSSGTALVTVADDGANTIVVAPGANGRLGPEHVDDRLLEGAAVLLCQLEIPLPTVEAALRAGRAQGVLTVLNPAPAAGPLPAGLLGLVDVVVPNETEATALVPGSATLAPEAAAGEAGAALVAAGAGVAVVTLGERGSVLVGPGRVQRVAAHRVRAVDTTAAGDAYVGALAAAMAFGEPLAEAVLRASAAGALAASRAGATPSLPRRHEVDRLLADAAPGGLLDVGAPGGRSALSPDDGRSRPRSAGEPPAGPRRPPPPGGRGRGPGDRPRGGGSRS